MSQGAWIVGRGTPFDCSHGKTMHRFLLRLECHNCGRIIEEELIFKCKADDIFGSGTTLTARNVGCKICRYDNVYGYFICEPGRDDQIDSRDAMLTLNIKNIDI